MKIITISERGYIKATPAEYHRPQSRAGLGILSMKITPKTGKIVATASSQEDEMLLVTTAEGRAILFSVDQIPISGRNTQGVVAIRLAKGDKVVSLTVL